MARADLLNILYSAHKTPLEFQFDSLMAPPLLSLLSVYDIKQLYDLARDPKLSSKLNKKLEYIKAILEPRGFVKFHSGTNRVVYRYLEDQSFIIKIALDKTGLSDNPMEFKNQFLLKPFVTKVFEVSPCGTVGLFERVQPITSRQEFMSIAEDVFDLLNDKIIGEYVLEDIGSSYFMNFGLRNSFGPVLLDFPYCYKIDGNKLYCNIVDPFTGIPCGGAIDYDKGFNNLICTKCGAKIFARDLEAGIDNKKILIKGRKEYSTMKVTCYIPGQGEKETDTTISAKTYAEQVKRKKSTMKVDIINNHPPVDPMDEIKRLAILAKKQIQETEVKQKTLEKEKEILEVKVELNHETKSELESKETSHMKYQPLIKVKAPYKKVEEPEIINKPEDKVDVKPYTKEDYVEMNKDEEEDIDEYAETPIEEDVININIEANDNYEKIDYDPNEAEYVEGPVGSASHSSFNDELLEVYNTESQNKYPAKKQNKK